MAYQRCYWNLYCRDSQCIAAIFVKPPAQGSHQQHAGALATHIRSPLHLRRQNLLDRLQPHWGRGAVQAVQNKLCGTIVREVGVRSLLGREGRQLQHVSGLEVLPGSREAHGSDQPGKT